METCTLGRGGKMCAAPRPKPKYAAQSLEYFTLGRGRGLYPPGQEPVWLPGQLNPLWKICGRGRGPYLRPLNALPAVGAQAPAPVPMDVGQRDQLPEVRAANARASQGPRKMYGPRVVRSSRPSPAAIAALRQERREREQGWAVYGSLHQDRADTVVQPCKRHRPETKQVAVTLQPWTGARFVEGSF